ncbi:MAG: hypothetical protein Q8928_03895 [Bacteroidota bacterium]|nr:hypothetical protein [Bacteroidota bacterium]
MGNELTDKIRDDLSKINQLIEKIEKSEQIIDIERDLILSKLRSVYEAVQFLKFEDIEIPDLTENQVIEQKSLTIEPKLVKTDVKPKPIEEEFILIEEKPAQGPDPIKKEEEVLSNSQVHLKDIDPSHSDEKHIAPKKTEVPPKTEILADKFHASGFLNEAFAQFRDPNDLSKKLQNQPLSDIFLAIAINDKFLFIKQLFNNDATLFQDTITKLNNFNTFNEAVRHLDEHFSWDFNEPLVSKLLELVHRRYLSK